MIDRRMAGCFALPAIVNWHFHPVGRTKVEFFTLTGEQTLEYGSEVCD